MSLEALCGYQFYNERLFVLKSLCRGGWRSVEEVHQNTRSMLTYEAKDDAIARYLVRYGSIRGMKLEDDLRKIYIPRY